MKIDKKTGLILGLVIILAILGCLMFNHNTIEQFDTLNNDEKKDKEIDKYNSEESENNDIEAVEESDEQNSSPTNNDSGSGYGPGDFYDNGFYDNRFYGDRKQSYQKIRKCREKKYDPNENNGNDDDDDDKENPDYLRDDRLSYKNHDGKCYPVKYDGEEAQTPGECENYNNLCPVDEHGCHMGAGYKWCPTKNKCLKTTGEGAEVCTDAHGCATDAGYEWCDLLNKCIKVTGDDREYCVENSECVMVMVIQ